MVRIRADMLCFRHASSDFPGPGMSDVKDETIGARVRRLREARRWSQAQIAERLRGVSQQSIDQLERNRVGTPRYLPELADVLGVRETWLRTGKGKPEPALRPLGRNLDQTLLSRVIAAADNAVRRSRLRISQDERAQIISVIYDEMTRAGKRGSLAGMRIAADAILAYERLRRRER